MLSKFRVLIAICLLIANLVAFTACTSTATKEKAKAVEEVQPTPEPVKITKEDIDKAAKVNDVNFEAYKNGLTEQQIKSMQNWDRAVKMMQNYLSCRTFINVSKPDVVLIEQKEVELSRMMRKYGIDNQYTENKEDKTICFMDYQVDMLKSDTEKFKDSALIAISVNDTFSKDSYRDEIAYACNADSKGNIVILIFKDAIYFYEIAENGMKLHDLLLGADMEQAYYVE